MTGVQTCALPIYVAAGEGPPRIHEWPLWGISIPLASATPVRAFFVVSGEALHVGLIGVPEVGVGAGVDRTLHVPPR